MGETMDYDIFHPEKLIIERGEALLNDPAKTDFRPAYETLLQDYTKLARVASRLVRMGDQREGGLKQFGIKLRHQQLELEKAHAQLGRHAEILGAQVNARTQALTSSQEKLQQLVGLGIALSHEHEQNRFMSMILQGAQLLTKADGGLLFIRDTEDRLQCQRISIESLKISLGGSSEPVSRHPPVSLLNPTINQPGRLNLLAHTASSAQTIQIANSYTEKKFDFSYLHAMDKRHNYRSVSLLSVPLKFHQGEVRGVLLLINAQKPQRGVVPFSLEMVHFVESLASQAAVALDNNSLVMAQERLMESIVMLMATATDAKSSYTGGHCARVPELCRLLAEAVCGTQQGIFADFNMSAEENNAFRLAAWLHDCGKMATPEHVVDKATKLETIHNRIHEIRTRFEVLRRDRLIEYQQALLEGRQDPHRLKKTWQEACAVLAEEFAFVARCNVGGERMAPEAIARLEQIGARTWVRYFDDRLGLSYGELKRIAALPKRALPAQERLLDDKQEHIFFRTPGADAKGLDHYGITVKQPEFLYNHGELYNLRVAYGTLTEEERFKVNEHSILSIIMLQQLPFPKHLAGIPEIAGAHHETLIGTGYPRQLTKAEMSVQARMLAIADIFEALTAADRPYKAPKTLSEALAIMSVMRDKQHIDADLFALFLSSGIYQTYAEAFLMPSQRDVVHIEAYL